ncbi:MAG TPA: transposase [Myxococcota bacterium]|nr:transposase [Myxococcota bacterium]
MQRRFRFSARKRRAKRGRPIGPNPRIRHLSRASFRAEHPCHVTLKVRRELPSLRLLSVVRAVEATFRRGCERGEFRLVHYTLQHDHVHLLVEAEGAEALGRGMKSIAARFALAVNRALKRHGAVLLDRYHFHVLKTPTEVRNALRYVLLNARKHWAQGLRRRGKDVARAMGASLRPVLDAASSARWFDGWSVPIEVDHSPPRAVARAQTWLLGPGWRRAGLIDPNEIPGAVRP